MRKWLLLLACLAWAAAPATFTEARLALGLRQQEGNYCVAPHSLTDALTMAGEGSVGATRTEFEQLLGTLDGATARDRNRQLPVLSANRVWVQRGFPIQPKYSAYCQEYFGAAPAELDFKGQPQEALNTINTWVKKETADRIPVLLTSVSPATRLVLTNATTLNAKWALPFDSKRTAEAPFQAADGTRPMVPMMHTSGSLPCLVEPGLQVVELPYQEAGLSLIVAVPEFGHLADLEKRMEAQTLDDWLTRLADPGEEGDSRLVALSFPKLEIRSEQLLLKAPLKALGLRRAFGDDSDFSGMSPQGDLLLIDDVVQATMIRFNEEGTEAAAATAVVMGVRSSPVEVNVDRPFLFFLVHRPTRAVLFSGRVVQP